MNNTDLTKISVIVPMYNPDTYLEKCIDSICAQTYSNLEIILIDDGSTDRTNYIASSFARKDHRIKLVREDNGGESHARNTGLSIATGQYVAFVDCDDWIDPEMYKTLIEAAMKYDLDVVACGWYKTTIVGDHEWISKKIKNKKKIDEKVLGREEFLLYQYKRDSYRALAYMWDKLFNKSILVDKCGKALKFDESYIIGGDLIFLAEALLNAHRIRYVDKAFYHYRIREGSGCHNENPKNYHDWVHSYERIIKEYKDNGIEQETIDYMKRFMAYHASHGLQFAIKKKDKEEIEYFRQIMIDNQEIYEKLNAEHKDWIAGYRKMLAIK